MTYGYPDITEVVAIISRVSDLEFKDTQNKYAMEMARTDIINKAISADSVAEQTMLFNTLKLNLESEGKDADRIITGIRNDALLKQIDEMQAEIERLKAENVELRSLIEERKKEFQPLTWEQRGVPVL